MSDEDTCQETVPAKNVIMFLTSLTMAIYTLTEEARTGKYYIKNNLL